MKTIILFDRDVYPNEGPRTRWWADRCGGFTVGLYQDIDINDPGCSKNTTILVEYFGEDISGDERTEHVLMETAVEAVKRIIFNFMEEQARVKSWVGYKRFQ